LRVWSPDHLINVQSLVVQEKQWSLVAFDQRAFRRVGKNPSVSWLGNPSTLQFADPKGGTRVVLDPYRPGEALRLIDAHGMQARAGVPTMLLRIQKLPEGILESYDLSSLATISVGQLSKPRTSGRPYGGVT
jgi:acyl-coenzyme A synthetase/AMP-(fatty) acid ligase